MQYPNDPADDWKKDRQEDLKKEKNIGDNYPNLPIHYIPQCPACTNKNIIIGQTTCYCNVCGHRWKKIEELFEIKTGKPITFDDVLDFHNELENLKIKLKDLEV